MLPNPEFINQPKEFWANIRTISQKVGYTVRQRKKGVHGQVGPIHVPTLDEILEAFESLRLNAGHLIEAGRPTTFGKAVVRYFDYRATVLNGTVEKLLMNAEQAVQMFERLREKHQSQRTVPMNKQSQEKKRPAYFTGMINMLIEAGIRGLPCNYNPQELTTVTRDQAPFRTLARRIDGAFPGPVDPIAVWEIKEYYYTTTFGSRVADGVYETLLDGMELQELDAALRMDSKRLIDRIDHVLMIDAHYTWWVKGRSYLCRVIDLLNMGYVGEVLFGREIETRLPVIARRWAKTYRARQKTT
jgi:hypothetical protein